MGDETLEVVITADDRASGVFGGLHNVLGGLATVLTVGIVAAAAAAGAALFGMFNIISDSVSSAMEAEQAITQLNQVIKSTEGIAGVTSEMAQELASSLQQVTRYSDEAIVGAENLLLTFTSIGKDIFPEATKMVLDMSTALGQDLKSSAIQLGKALQDPVLGVTALRRVGVNFNAEAKETIKNMVEMGDMAGAQAFIMAELTREFGGSAEAAGTTFAGALDILKNRFDEIKEQLGAAVIPILQMLMEKVIVPLIPYIEKAALALGNFLTTLSASAGFQEFIDNVGAGLINLITLFTDFMDGGLSFPTFELPPFLTAMLDWWTVNGPWIKEQASLLFAGLVDGISAASVSVAPFINDVLVLFTDWFTENGPLIEKFATQIVTAWNEKIIPALTVAWEAIQPIILALIAGILDIGTFIMALSVQDWPAAWAALISIAQNAWVIIQNVVMGALGIIAALMGTSLAAIGAQWSNNWKQFKQILEQSLTIIALFLAEQLLKMRNLFMAPFNTDAFLAVRDAIGGIASTILDVVSAAGRMANALANLALPDWLTPGSPTPFEVGLIGIGNALDNLGNVPFPAFGGQNPLSAGALAGGAGVRAGAPITLNFTYAPAVAFGSEREMRDRISPVLVELLREAQNNGVI